MNPAQRVVRSHLPLMSTLARWRKLRGNAPRRGMIAMFHVGRCGSTVLTDVLHRHSRIRWGGELFDQIRSTTPGFQPTRAWLRAVLEVEAYRRPSDYFGFEPRIHDFNPDCVTLSIREYVAFLREIGFTHFVVLTRSNLLRVVISSLVAGRSGALHSTAKPAGPTRITLDPRSPWGSWAGSLVEIIADFQRFYAEVEAALDGSAWLGLNYETDIQPGLDHAYGKVCRFLDVAPEPYQVRYERTNPYPVAQMLTNFDDVAAALRGTPFEWMLAA